MEDLTIVNYSSTRQQLQRLRQLNDRFRRTLDRELGFVIFSERIKILSNEERSDILSRVMFFRDFDENLDTNGDHSKGIIKYKQYQVAFKVDYYDPAMCYTSDDPCNVEKTIRILTIQLLEEST